MILTLAGVEKNVVKNTLAISQNMTYTVDTLKATIQSDTEPEQGTEVIVTEGSETMFSGVVRSASLVDSVTMWWEIGCDDYTALVDRKLVVEEYSGQSASDIVLDIISKYLTVDFSDSGVVAGAPVVEFIQFNYKRPSECFKALCDYVGWQWYVDYDKVVRFFSAESLLESAPIDITEANTHQFDRFQFNADTTNLRNRVFIMGGTFQSPTLLSEEWSSDGLQRAWVLPYKPHGITPYIAGVAKTVGIENVTDSTTVDFLVNYEEKRLLLGTNTATPAAGVTLKRTYYPDIDVITVSEDLASQAAMKAIQGGDGVYEHVIVDNTITTLEAAEAIGAKDIKQYGNPAVTGAFETMVSGWTPGQLLRIDLPGRGITNTYMVQSVQLKRANDDWVYVPRFGGRLYGLADFLQALVSQQQQVSAQTAVLQKYVYAPETVGIVDELATTSKTGQYICGDPDAICGLTVPMAS